jgi:hypothetical protein
MSQTLDSAGDRRPFRTPLSAAMLCGALSAAVYTLLRYLATLNINLGIDHSLLFFTLLLQSLVQLLPPVLVHGTSLRLKWVRYAFLHAGLRFLSGVYLISWLANGLRLGFTSVVSLGVLLLIIQEVGAIAFCIFLHRMFIDSARLGKVILYAQVPCVLNVVMYLVRYRDDRPEMDAVSVMASFLIAVSGMALMTLPFEKAWQKARAGERGGAALLNEVPTAP